jgi:surface polysaccharide O-acyltransferase-like enzyme
MARIGVGLAVMRATGYCFRAGGGSWARESHAPIEHAIQIRGTLEMTTSDLTDRPSARYAALDWLRVAAIIGVVMHHSGPELMRSDVERYVRSMLVAFDIPVFLFASGFLYFRPRPIPTRELGRRGIRVLIPYGVASALVWLSGLRTPDGLSDVVFRLLTGSALGIYYYVFLIAVSILLIWPLSRLHRRHVLALALCAHIYPMVAAVVPELSVGADMFWALRNPLFYSWAYFLTGWAVAAYLEDIDRVRRAWPVPLWLVGIGGIALWMINGGNWLGVPLISNGRAVYSLSVILVFSLALGGRPPPRLILFIGQAGFTIYLYHLFIVDPLRAAWVAWPWMLSVPLLTVIGVGGPALIALAARRLLGERSRLWIG